MDVIDLSAARAEREEIRKAHMSDIESLVSIMVRLTVGQANRAFAVASPLAKTDEELGRIIYRGVRRKLLAFLRSSMKGLSPEVLNAMLQQASDLYRDRLCTLIAERDAANGWADQRAEALAALKPWPCYTILRAQGIGSVLEWIDLIERTGEKLKPASRKTLSMARVSLAAGEWVGTEAEYLINRLIKARWKQGHRVECATPAVGMA